MLFKGLRREEDEQPIEVVNESTLGDAPEMKDVTKKDLIEIAEMNGISINSKATKEEIYKSVFGG